MLAPPEPRRRSRLIPWLATLVMAGTAFGLGVWQVQRLAWKTALIESLAQRGNEAPLALPPAAQWPMLGPDDEFRRVTVGPLQPFGEPARVFVAGSALRSDITAPGVYLFQPMRLPDGSTVVLNRGYVPAQGPAEVCPSPAGGTVTATLRWPERSWFGSTERGRDGLWLGFDHRAMARALGWGEVAPFYLDQEAPAGDCYPRPARLTPRLSNPHLGYAITWFGLAAAIVIGFAVWARGARAARRPPAVP